MPGKDGKISLTIETTKLETPDEKDELFRSPHPYHRRGPSLSQRDRDIDEARCSNLRNEIASTPRAFENSYFDADHRKRRKNDHVSGDSGTEADDEKDSHLLRLPAPSARPRKGLKGSTDSGSPLLTPSYLDDEERRINLEAQVRQRANVQSQSTEVETAKVKEKFRRRRRAEAMRRTTETTLFLTTCYIVLADRLPHLDDLLGSEEAAFASRDNRAHELLVFAAAVSALYTLYPVRIVFHNHALNLAKKKSRFYIHFPAAFDPAPLLYPVLLPVLVAWLNDQVLSNAVLPNLILGLSSIPSKIIPAGDLAWYSSPQWIVSVLPLFQLRASLPVLPLLPGAASVDRLSLEVLTLLYPLHQALLPLLQYLTTTSLLVTELQLCSVALINLLVLSSSPQAVILKSILWIGGLGLAFFCDSILKTGVAIARIPSWRFKRPPSGGHSGLAAPQAVYNYVRSLTRQKSGNTRDSDSFGDERYTTMSARARQSNRKLQKMDTTDLDIKQHAARSMKVPTLPVSAKDDGRIMDGQPSGIVDTKFVNSGRHRSRTLPVTSSGLGKEDAKNGAGRFELDAGASHWSGSLKSLTNSQARMIRWIIAVYFYSVVIGLIFLPIKSYVRHQALFGVEPIGWALNYMLGDLELFSFEVKNWSLQSWIPQSDGRTVAPLAGPLGWAEMQRVHLGFANTRLSICMYALGIIVAGLALVFRLSTIVEVDTRRKVFHGMMVAMFLPTTFVDPPFVALAFIIMLAVFLILDLIRASQLQPFARPLTHFLAPYVDGRDHRGPVVVSHIFLLIGCAIPLWLSLSLVPRKGKSSWEGWEVGARDLSMVSGIICVGLGDAAASLVGRRYGRRRWCWTGGKSLEGSFAFIAAVAVGLSVAQFWLRFGGWASDSKDSVATFFFKATVAGIGASLTEAVLTGGNDNVIVPVILWLWVKGLRI